MRDVHLCDPGQLARDDFLVNPVGDTQLGPCDDEPQVFKFGLDSYALLHDRYVFSAKEGATYDIFSVSFFDPYLLRIYDSAGNTIVANDESDDPSAFNLGDGYYAVDAVYDWVAPYTGDYYVSANWNQGSYYKFYSLMIDEDVDTVKPTTSLPVITISPTSTSLTEGDSGSQSLTFTVSLSASATSAVTVNYATANGTATSGSDYTSTSGKLSFAVGETSKTINVPVLGDTSVESNETFTLTLSSPSGATLGSAVNATATIMNNDSATPTGISATSGNDVIKSLAGNDSIDGLGGIDTVIFNSARSGYTLKAASTGYTISGPDGNDTLTNIERLQFADKIVAVDINGNAGSVYRLYQAAFNRTPDSGGLKYWVGRMDTGTSLDQMSAGFIDSAEFKAMYGTNPSTTDFVSKLYNNVLHRAPDTGGYNWWVNEINVSHRGRDNVLACFADSPENQAGVIGVIQNGIELPL